MPATATDPLDLLTGSLSVPSEMRTAEWSRVPQWVREQSFYMAGVSRAEILQEFRDIVDVAARGAEGEFALRKEWEQFLARVGYKPEPGQEGTIKDLRSLRRFNVALRTNLAIMNGWARRENGLRPGPLRAHPCYELVRISPAQVPRDWPERFLAVGGTLHDGRMIAPKLDLLWAELGDIRNFPDGLGTDHPPFAWGSGMGWKIVGSREVMDLGIMTREEILAQAASAAERPVHSPGANLSATPRVTEPALREALAAELEGLAEWQGDKLVFTDPNGSRPVTQDELIETWSRPLPEDFHDIAPDGHFQRESLRRWVGDHDDFRDAGHTNIHDDLLRLVGRLRNAASPRLFRGMSIERQKMENLLRTWASDGYTTSPGFVVESWTDSAEAAGRYAGRGSRGRWRVIVETDAPGPARDITALVRSIAPGVDKKKIPGVEHDSEWVMPKGAALQVVKILRDAKNYTVRVITRAGSPSSLRSASGGSAPGAGRAASSPPPSGSPPEGGASPSSSR